MLKLITQVIHFDNLEFTHRKRGNNNSTQVGDNMKRPKLDNNKTGPFMPHFGEEVPQPSSNVGTKPKKAPKGEAKEKNGEQSKMTIFNFRKEKLCLPNS